MRTACAASSSVAGATRVVSRRRARRSLHARFPRRSPCWPVIALRNPHHSVCRSCSDIEQAAPCHPLLASRTGHGGVSDRGLPDTFQSREPHGPSGPFGAADGPVQRTFSTPQPKIDNASPFKKQTSEQTARGAKLQEQTCPFVSQPTEALNGRQAVQVDGPRTFSRFTDAKLSVLYSQMSRVSDNGVVVRRPYLLGLRSHGRFRRSDYASFSYLGPDRTAYRWGYRCLCSVGG